LKEALALAETIPDIPRVTSRTLTDHAETLRLRGETGQALEALERAEALQRQHGLHGDRAEFTGLVRAKVAPTAPGLAEQLAAIQRVLDRAGNPVGQARALLLEARLFPQRARERPILQRVHTLREGVPSLRDCPVAQAILDRWDTWLEGGRVSAWGAGFFQGL
jgi:hypothetical protein